MRVSSGCGDGCRHDECRRARAFTRPILCAHEAGVDSPADSLPESYFGNTLQESNMAEDCPLPCFITRGYMNSWPFCLGA